MNGKKIIVLVLALVCLVSLTAACGAPAADAPAADAPAEVIVVGVLYQGLDSPYVVSLKTQMDKLDEARDDIKLISLDGLSDAAKQVSQTETLIAQGVDIIILDAISLEGCTPSVDAANKAGIPIFTLIGPVANQEDCLTVVGSDHKDSGIIEMEIVAKDFDGVANILVIEGPLGHFAQVARLEGYEQVMADNPGIKIVAINTANWQRDEALTLTENWIQAGEQFDAIVSENDNMALGAVKALQDAGLLDTVKVYGIDGDDDALQAVKDGTLAATVLQSALGQAEKAFDVVDMIVAGTPIDPEYMVPFIGVTSENVDEIIANK